MRRFLRLPAVRHGTVVLLFIGLTVIMTWPAASRLSSHLLGGRDDLLIHQWTFWWVKEALRTGQNPFYTPLLYHPEGVALTSHNIAWMHIAFWLPLQAFFGSTLAYNLLMLAVYVLNGYCAYVYLADTTGSRAAAIVGGAIFGFWPYTLSHYDHPNMVALFWLPLILLLLRRLAREPYRRTIWPAALALALFGLTRWQLLLMAAPLILAVAIVDWVRLPRSANRMIFSRYLRVGLFAGLLMAPLALPLLADQITATEPDDIAIVEPEFGRTDLLAFVTPPATHPFWGERFAPVTDTFAATAVYTPYLGYATLLLIAVGLVLRPRRALPWLAPFFVFGLLALGETLVIRGQPFGESILPYSWVSESTYFTILRRPHRLNLMLALPAAIMAAWGVQALAARRPRSAWLIAPLALTLILIDYAPQPFATTQPTVPAFYAELAAEPGAFAVIDLPINDRAYDKWAMYYQTVHRRPIATGHVSRLPSEAFTFLDSVPILANARRNDSVPDVNQPDIGRQLAQLAEVDIRYLVLHKQFANQGLIDRWRDWLTVPPVHEDDEVVVFDTTPAPEPATTLVDGLGLLRATLTPANPVQGGSIRLDIRWATTRSPDRDWVVCFGLGPDDPDATCGPPVAEWPTSEWAAGEIARGSYTYPVRLGAEPGPASLHLWLVDGTTGLATASRSLGRVEVQPFDPATPQLVEWQSGLRLLGYTKNDGAITFFWQSEAALDEAYKLFIHAVDPLSGEIVAQVDIEPRGWTYPTTSWLPGEVVRDVVALPVIQDREGVVYRIGWYSAADLTRLPLAGGSATGGDTWTIGEDQP